MKQFIFMYDNILLDRLDDGTDDETDVIHIECDDDEHQMFVLNDKHYIIDLLLRDEADEITVLYLIVMHNDELDDEYIECNDVLIQQIAVEKIEIDDELDLIIEGVLGVLDEVLEHSDSDEPLALDITLDDDEDDGIDEVEPMIMIVIMMEDDEVEVVDMYGLQQTVNIIQNQLV